MEGPPLPVSVGAASSLRTTAVGLHSLYIALAPFVFT